MDGNEPGKHRKFLTTAGVDLLRGLVALAIGLFIVHWVTKLFERYPQMDVHLK